jgi:predicted RNA-binding protein with PUA-like domain
MTVTITWHVHAQKSDESNPKWFMVDLTFVSRAENFIPLAVLRNMAALTSDTPPEGVEYLGTEGVRAVKSTYIALAVICGCYLPPAL